MAQKGFKAWCEKISSQFRSKLGIPSIDPLCAWALAGHLNVIVWEPAEIPNLPQSDIDHLLGPAQSEWSAATLSSGQNSVVILNSSHTPGRQSNDLMHELSHLICGHKASRVDIAGEDEPMYLHSYDKEQEEEADWLASTLLLPRVALVHIKSIKMSLSAATKKYNVSKPLLEYRLRITGVNKQFNYKAKKNN